LIKSAESNPTKEVLNCLRVLTRVLPVVFEVQGESNTFELDLLWKKVEVVEPDEDQTESQFVIENEDGSDDEAEQSHKQSSGTRSPQGGKTKALPSLVEQLFNAITDLSFCCGFTLPKSLQVDHHKVNYIIW